MPRMTKRYDCMNVGRFSKRLERVKMTHSKTGKLFRLSRQEGSTTEVLIKAIKWVRPYTNPNSLAIPSSA